MVYADWPNYIFHVPRADMALIQSVPTEIRECNLNWLRLQILALEDDPEAMTFPTVFRHFPEVTLGSLTFAKVMEMLEPYTITFEDGQYAVDLTGANSNFGDRVNVNQVSVRSSNSAGMTSSPAIEYLAFDDQVTVNISSGSAGQTYPVGTVQYPVDNIVDACAIADYRQITKIKFKHHGNVLDNDYDYTGFVLEGDAQATTSLHVEPLPNLTSALVQGLTFSGTVDGGLALKDCKIDGVTFFSGSMRECGLTASPVILGGSGTATFNKCISLVAGGNARPQIDFDNEPTNLAIRGWEGGLELVNKTNATGEVSIDMNSGVLYLRSSCTAGEITVRGLGRLVDESGPNCVVKYEGLLDPDYVQQLTYEDAIHYDSASTYDTTIYPAGTPRHPVNNISAALVIAGARGLTSLHFVGDVTFTTLDFPTFSKGNIHGENHTSSIATVDGVVFTETTFTEAKVTGTFGAGSTVSFRECVLVDVGNCTYDAHNTTLEGTITFPNVVGRSYFGDITTGNFDGATTILDFAGTTGHYIAMHNFSGNVIIKNLTDASLVHSWNMHAGKLTLDSTCTAGTFKVRGVGELVNNSTMTVDNDLIDPSNLTADVDPAQIAEAVWDESLTGATHNIPTSAGRRLRQIAGAVVYDGTAAGAGVNGNQIILDNDAADYDGAYDPSIIAIVEGTGVGQCRLILDYNGATRTASVDRTWKVLPDATSEYVIFGDAGREHVNEGLALGGTINTITLNDQASDFDEAYTGQTVFLRSGAGEDQAAKVHSYNGTTKVATMCKDWNITPDTTTAYVMLPTGAFDGNELITQITNSVWSDNLGSGTAQEMINLIDGKIDAVDAAVDANSGAIAVVDGVVDGLVTQLTTVEDKVDTIDTVADGIASSVTGIESAVDSAAVASAVWDSATASHVTPDTFGGELAQKSDTPDVNTDAISAAVWSHDPNLDGTALDKLDQIASDASATRKHTINKAVISGDERTVTIYDDDLITVLYEFDVSFDKKVRTPK